MSAHSSILAWEILWTEEPGRLQSKGLWKVRHHRAHTRTKKSEQSHCLSPPINMLTGGHLHILSH